MSKLQTWMAGANKDDEAVSLLVGLSRAQVSRIRRSKSRPSPDAAVKLELVTGIPWHEFIKPAPAKPS